ncbi:type IV secretion system protein [Nocardiopsis quinghaiensis]|uniref:type IV secretion system protein n=1 Tax=Nocardiopsis quinghaiensis TaxID=464995 RepID=UPI001238A00A|nr:type IV secretion system protein [Nocardiopsis quinghaiensis]
MSLRPWAAAVLVITLSGMALVGSAEGAEAAPTPADVPGDEEPLPTDPQECGTFDYGCRVTVGFYVWVADFIADSVEFTITLAALPALATPPPTDGIRTVWGEVLTVANSLYILVIVAAGVLLMSYQTVQTSAGVKELLPRVVLAFVTANSSFLLTEMMRELANGIAVNMLDGAVTGDNLSDTLARVLGNPSGEALVVLLMMLAASMLAFFFMLAAIVRIVLWILLTVAAPLALACHALPQTEGIARLWWRAMGALMITQIAQALVLRLIVTLFLSRDAAPDFIEAAQGVIDVLLILCCMYVLVRIPFWAFKQVFNYQKSPLVKGAKIAASLLVFRGLGRAFAAKKTAAATTASQTASRTPTTTPASPPTRTAQRWHQPELPNFSARLPYRQDPLPGMDRQIDRRAQARLRERRRYHQPELPRPRRVPPPRWRQEPLPQWQEPTPRQEMLPQARRLPPSKPRPRQDALFPPPDHRRPRRRR